LTASSKHAQPEIDHRIPDDQRPTALLLIAISRLSKITNLDTARRLRAFDLDLSEYAVISALWHQPNGRPMSPTELSHALLQTTSGITKTLRRLEHDGLVERVKSPIDKRAQLISIKRKAADIVEHVDREVFKNARDYLFLEDDEEFTNIANTMFSFMLKANSGMASDRYGR
jgi:DNA-binding MarR family transcriptional regulator